VDFGYFKFRSLIGRSLAVPNLSVFPLIPAYSRSESRSDLDFLDLRSGFEP